MTVNLKSFFSTLFFTTCLVGFAFGGTAHAFQGKDQIPKLSGEVHISKEDFTAQSDLVQEKPRNDDSLAYHIRLPKGWQKIDNPVNGIDDNSNILHQISTYAGPPRIEHRSLLRIRTADATSLISMDDWFIGYMMQMGFAIEGMTVDSPRRITAQYAVFEDNEPFIVRAVATLSGHHIILAEYLVPQNVYQAERDQQIWAMTGFDLTSPNLAPPVDVKTFSFLNVVKFDYPANWNFPDPGIRDFNRMDAHISNTLSSIPQKYEQKIPDRMGGRIDISVISRTENTQITSEINRLNAELTSKNYKLGKYLGNIKIDPLPSLTQNIRVDSYELDGLTEKLTGYEYWIAVLQTPDYYVLVQLTTLGRNDNFILWAENTETYKTLIRSLSPATYN